MYNISRFIEKKTSIDIIIIGGSMFKTGLRKNFVVSLLLAGALFISGIAIMTLPSYYGKLKMSDYEINNLFISFSIIFTLVNIFKYGILKKNPTREAIFLALVGVVSGIFNVLFIKHFSSSFTLSMSLLVFTVLVTVVKLFTIDYYHDREDAFFYIETMLLIIFFIMGLMLAFNLFDDKILQAMMLGFFIVLISILDGINGSLKSLIKSKRFQSKIKLK